MNTHGQDSMKTDAEEGIPTDLHRPSKLMIFVVDAAADVVR